MQIKKYQLDQQLDLEQDTQIKKIQDQQKKIKFMSKTKKVQSRTASREFNNPIYAGFDLFQQNKETTKWGPWVQQRQRTPIQKSRSLQPNKIFKVTTFHFRNQKLSQHNNERKAPTQMKIRPKNQLPQIKEKTIQTLKQIRFSSLQLIPKQKEILPIKQIIPKSKKAALDSKRLKYELQLREQYVKKARMLGDFGKTIKMGTVVYNYCTDNNAQGSLLEYHRKKMNQLVKPVIENIEHSEKKIQRWKSNEKMLKKINNNNRNLL